MRSFSEYDPAVTAVYFAAVMGLAMFSNSPAITLLSLCGALLYFFSLNGTSGGRFHLFAFLLFIILAAVNPLVSHNGTTVLLVVNDRPITLEALIYGLCSSVLITGTLYWLRCFTQIMTTDKLLRVTGFLSPKLSLVLSMAVRFVPLFGRQWQKINNAQRAMGLYREDNAIDGARGSLRVFSVLVTWALENGITTADSMEARGCGVSRRTSFHKFRLRHGDYILLAAELILFAGAASAAAAGAFDFSCYPSVTMAERDWRTYTGAAAYGLLVLLPVIIDMEARIRWSLLKPTGLALSIPERKNMP
ncbi:MAG: energy-coupling factor transporter transmembrane protein EcfT [Ruminococcus sp.]|nr:energy-coupling factor transporter transmembrane protein EcfT [Ruminococcus sp.]